MDYSRIAPIMSNLWSPLAAVTSSWRGKNNAQIAVAAGAASIVPAKPRVILQIYKRNLSHELIYSGGAFTLNFLREDQLPLISDFGLVSGRDREKLSGVPHRVGPSGCPVLEESWGYLDCRVVNAMDGGDMTCFLAEVLEGDTLDAGGPLWWRDARTRLPSAVMEEWDRKIGEEIAFSTARMDRIDHTPWEPRN